VAVLFADLAGFTKLTSEADAEEVHRLLGRYFEVVDGIVARSGGTVDKHIGDATMAVFGAPVAHGNDVERAVRAACDIHDAMAALSAEFGRTLATHVGVASGEVVAASTGSAVRADYTVTGDAVNLASRLEELAGAGETVVSDDVRAALGSRLDAESRGTVAVRGFAREMPVWRVRAIHAPAPERHRLVGRASERARFDTRLASLREAGHGGALLLRGDPGLGKTRLAEELATAAAAAGCDVHRASVVDFGAAQGSDAVGALARSLVGVGPADGDDIARAALDRAVADGLVRDEHEPLVADLLGATQRPGGRFGAMDPVTRMRGRIEALADLAVRASHRRPEAFVVEDLHWAAPAVIDALAALADRAQEHPIVLVLTSRCEGDPVSGIWPAGRCERVDIPPLSVDESLEFAQAILEAHPDIARRCVARAQGNPLFLSQLLQSGAEGDALPGTIANVVLARLDRLPPADKAALQAAAVVGVRFDPALVAHLTGKSAGFDEAIARDLVRPAEAPGELMFTHALIRDGAYASLLHSARRDVHRRAAGWFADRDPALRAAHLDRADDPGAAEAYLAAARAAARALRHDAALVLARRGGELRAPPSTRYALAAFEGELARDLGDAPASAEAYERALSLAADDRERCEAHIGIGAAHRLTSAVGPAMAALDAAEPIATRLGAHRELARISYLRGNLEFVRGDTGACARHHERSLAHAREAGDDECEAQALSGVADALYAQGRMASAHDAFAGCVELCDRRGNLRFSLMNRCMIGITGAYLCRLRESLVAIDEARVAARDIGHRVAEVMTGECAGLVLVDAGLFREAREPLEHSLALARRIASRRFAALDLALLGCIAWHDGDGEAARRLLDESWTMCEEIGTRFAGPIVLGMMARVAADDAGRRAAISRGEAMLDDGAMAHNHFWFRRDAIDASLAAGDFDAAERHAEALERYASAEPLPWTDFHIARARALACAGRGVADSVALRALRERGVELGRHAALPGIDEALASAFL
jgi:class 3 adenylate cyclase/tetratricopeptide (TPR) repeat protein